MTCGCMSLHFNALSGLTQTCLTAYLDPVSSWIQAFHRLCISVHSLGSVSETRPTKGTSTSIFFVLLATPQCSNVASMVITASLSFSAMSPTKEMSSAYSIIYITTSSESVRFLQCMSWSFIL